MRITVVTPTYNEANNLPILARKLFALPLDLNWLVVDDQSPDGTSAVAETLQKEYPGRLQLMTRPCKSGFSSAYLEGFRMALQSDAHAIAQMDADGSHDPSILLAMVEQLKECDMVLGSRYTEGGGVDETWPPWRKALSAFGNLYARTILRLPFKDVTTGYRLWRREALARIPLERVQSTGYIFLVEMAYMAKCLGLHITETPIYFADRRSGRSKMSLRIQVEAAFRVWNVLWTSGHLRQNSTMKNSGEN